MSVEIFIARHGQNIDNVSGILNGHRDLPLTEIGIQQAHDLADGIEAAGLTFNAVYSSPLSRAHETAKIVCRALGIELPPVVLPELIERDFGLATGRPIQEVVQEAGSNVIKTDSVTYVIDFEGGESFPRALERAHRALERVHYLQQDGKALLVCHGDIGKMVYAAATGKPWEAVLRDFHFGNCDLIEVNSNDSTHKVQLPQHNL